MQCGVFKSQYCPARSDRGKETSSFHFWRIFSWETALKIVQSQNRSLYSVLCPKNLAIVTCKRHLSIDMKTKVVQHVPRTQRCPSLDFLLEPEPIFFYFVFLGEPEPELFWFSIFVGARARACFSLSFGWSRSQSFFGFGFLGEPDLELSLAPSFGWS